MPTLSRRDLRRLRSDRYRREPASRRGRGRRSFTRTDGGYAFPAVPVPEGQRGRGRERYVIVIEAADPLGRGRRVYGGRAAPGFEKFYQANCDLADKGR